MIGVTTCYTGPNGDWSTGMATVNLNGAAGRAVKRALPTLRASAGGAISRPKSHSIFGALTDIVSDIGSAEADWRLGALDVRTFDKLPTSKLLDLLTRLHPDISSALWTFLRMANPGWSYDVRDRLGEEGVSITGPPRVALDAFMAEMSLRNKGLDSLWDALFMAVFLRGGALAELVIWEGQPYTLLMPDPAILDWRPIDDPILGRRWQMGQRDANRQFRSLEVATIAYKPIDPLPETPWGRPLAEPSLFVSVFLLGLLHDLKRVVQQQGYPRLDIAVDVEALIDTIRGQSSEDVPATYEELSEFAQSVIDLVKTAYGKLEPDDAYVHDTTISVNKPVGAVDTSVLGGIDVLVRVLERMSIRALKTLPVLMGVNESTTETHARIQWKTYQANIRSLQDTVRNVIEYLLTVALRVMGQPGFVAFKFETFDSSDEQVAAITAGLRLDNAIKAYEAGYVSQDQAAFMALGLPTADQPEPRVSATPAGTEQPASDPPDGEESS